MSRLLGLSVLASMRVTVTMPTTDMTAAASVKATAAFAIIVDKTVIEELAGRPDVAIGCAWS